MNKIILKPNIKIIMPHTCNKISKKFDNCQVKSPRRAVQLTAWLWYVTREDTKILQTKKKKKKEKLKKKNLSELYCRSLSTFIYMHVFQWVKCWNQIKVIITPIWCRSNASAMDCRCYRRCWPHRQCETCCTWNWSGTIAAETIRLYACLCVCVCKVHCLADD